MPRTSLLERGIVEVTPHRAAGQASVKARLDSGHCGVTERTVYVARTCFNSSVIYCIYLTSVKLSIALWTKSFTRHEAINMGISAEATEPFLHEYKYTDSGTSKDWRTTPFQRGRGVRLVIWQLLFGTLVLVFSNVTTYYIVTRNTGANLDHICASHTSEWCKLGYILLPLSNTQQHQSFATWTSNMKQCFLTAL